MKGRLYQDTNLDMQFAPVIDIPFANETVLLVYRSSAAARSSGDIHWWR